MWSSIRPRCPGDCLPVRSTGDCSVPKLARRPGIALVVAGDCPAAELRGRVGLPAARAGDVSVPELGGGGGSGALDRDNHRSDVSSLDNDGGAQDCEKKWNFHGRDILMMAGLSVTA